MACAPAVAEIPQLCLSSCVPCCFGLLSSSLPSMWPARLTKQNCCLAFRPRSDSMTACARTPSCVMKSRAWGMNTSALRLCTRSWRRNCVVFVVRWEKSLRSPPLPMMPGEFVGGRDHLICMPSLTSARKHKNNWITEEVIREHHVQKRRPWESSFSWKTILKTNKQKNTQGNDHL